MLKKQIKNLLLLSMGLLLWSNALCSDKGTEILNTSQQLLIVTAESWEANQGQLQYFERKDTKSDWQVTGKTMPVVLGKAGLGWSTAYPLIDLEGPKKHEGDNRTPAGMFNLGQAFGFAHLSPVNTKLLYLAITPNTVCVDDQESRFYTRIVETDKILQPDWKDAEKMHDVARYEQGIVVRYNSRKPIAGAGSCIFIHHWLNSADPTSGCVALSSSDLSELLTRLDSNKRPVLVILPKGEYQHLAKSWNLPELG